MHTKLCDDDNDDEDGDDDDYDDDDNDDNNLDNHNKYNQEYKYIFLVDQQLNNPVYLDPVYLWSIVSVSQCICELFYLWASVSVSYSICEPVYLWASVSWASEYWSSVYVLCHRSKLIGTWYIKI